MKDNGSAYTVMIAEDELLVRVGLNLTVPWSDFGMRVVSVVEDGISAWEAYQHLHPNIVLTDIRMPGMDGVELIQHIRESRESCEIIVITCVEKFDTLYQLMRLDITGYLTKATMAQKDIAELLRKAEHRLKQEGVSADSVPTGTAQPEDPLVGFIFHHHDSKRYLADCQETGQPVKHPQCCIVIQWGAQLQPILKSSVTSIFQKRLHPLGATEVFSEEAFLLISLTELACSNRQEIKSLIRELILYTNDVLDVKLRIVICQTEGSVEKLAIFAGQWEEVLQNPYFYPDALTVMEADIPVPCGNPDLYDCVTLLQERILVLLPSSRYQKSKLLLLTYLDTIEESIGSNRQLFEQSLQSLGEMYLSSSEKTDGGKEWADSLRTTIAKAETADEAFSALENSIFGSSAFFHPVYGKKMTDTIRYIREHMGQNISLTDMAAMVCLSPNYYSTLFKQMLGCSFSEYIGCVRIDRACDFIDSGKFSIQKVSALCGFSDATYFSRFFKQKTGISPNRWRAVK